MSDGGVRARSPALCWIQYLRGLAALMVVFYHIFHWEEQPWQFNPLKAFTGPRHGVEIFFVISGFIMYTAARNEPVMEFYKRRIIRIVPLYWLATLVPIAIAWLGGELFSRLSILRSLLFIPFHNPSYNGKIVPLLVPGWTLNYEMFFYLLFGIAIAFGRPVLMLSVTMLALLAAGALVSFSNAILVTYTSPPLFEFLAGVWLGVAFQRLDFSRAAALLPVGLLVLLSGDWLEWPRFFGISLPSIAVVAGALGFETRGIGLSRRFPRLLGDASYAIYLAHAVIIDMVFSVYKLLPLQGAMQLVPLVAVVMTVATLGGILLHLYVERPLIAFLNAHFVKRRPTPRSDSTATPAR